MPIYAMRKLESWRTYEKNKRKTFACGELNSFSSAMDSPRRLQRGKVRVCMFQLGKLLPDGVSFGTTFDSVVSDHGFQIKVPGEARGNSWQLIIVPERLAAQLNHLKQAPKHMAYFLVQSQRQITRQRSVPGIKTLRRRKRSYMHPFHVVATLAPRRRFLRKTTELTLVLVEIFFSAPLDHFWPICEGNTWSLLTNLWRWHMVCIWW